MTTNVALIGAGAIARQHLRAWKDLAVPVAVFSKEGAENLVNSVGHGRAVTSERDTILAADVVDVVTPTHTHAEIVIRALRAGRDVICEKPLGLTVTEAARMVEAARENGVNLFPAHVVRFMAPYRQLRDALANGQIGVPAIARFSRTGAFPAWSPWFLDPQKSGGVVLDLMLHDLDFARWVLGPIDEVYATGLIRPDLPAQMAQATLRHQSGAISLVRAAWGASNLEFSSTFHVAGTEGVLSFDSAGSSSLEVSLEEPSKDGNPNPVSVVHPGTSPYLLELQSFLDVRRGVADPLVTADEAVEAVALANSVRQSIADGVPVKIGELH